MGGDKKERKRKTRPAKYKVYKMQAVSCQVGVMRASGDAAGVHGCNIKYQQYCSWPQSFDTRKIRRDGIRRRRCPSGGVPLSEPARLAAERVLEFKMAVAGIARAAMRGQSIGQHHLALMTRVCR